jgi:AcrR family transcriptional regulator
MPAQIDVAERLDAIAEATLHIAREEGFEGVTIRAVAARLGGSTTLVTKFVKSRAVLLSNAFRYIRRHWDADRDAAVRDRVGMDRLKALARWSLNTEGYDHAVRVLWIQGLSSARYDRRSYKHPRHEARREYDGVRAMVAAVGGDDNGWLADVLFLAFRGFYISTIEDPERWQSRRPAAAVERLLDMVESANVRARGQSFKRTTDKTNAARAGSKRR